MAPRGPSADGCPVVDAHMHLWDLERHYHPWLCDQPPVPFRYGDYGPLRRSYLPDDYRADSSRQRVVKSVYVEAEWDPADPLGETRWVEGVAARHGLPHAIVAQAWLDRDDVEDVLAQQAAHRLVRGIRHKPRAAATPESVAAGAPGSLSDPRWRAGYALLARHGLSFDLQVPYWHLPEAAWLARTYPDTLLILDHTGLPADRSVAGLAAWRGAMEALAREPNTAIKISGLGEPGRRWTIEANRGVVQEAIRLFGVDRAMFASNFPVDRLVADFDTIYDGFHAIVAHLPRQDRDKLFHDNAVRLYRIPA